MTDPCRSAGAISMIEERTRRHEKSIDGFTAALDTLNRSLLKISQALADIKHLHEDQQRNEKDINELFGRVRALEMAPGRAAGKAWWIIFGAATGSAGGLVTGLIMWGVKP